jgi:hypothetical protein
MGCFNSILVKCPHCDAQNEDQFKPGYMNGWNFPEEAEETPIEYLQSISGRSWICYNCENKFHTEVDVKIVISNPRVIK